MERLEIISKVEGQTEWVNYIVVVENRMALLEYV
jgi:hypothetical protein